ncbi:hypothetical protein PLCT2_01740 [Planctomycetaceae bacterium]|nr:hypothetical protein PLCT2_01740 [Planctomycetaceae bacterium]
MVVCAACVAIGAGLALLFAPAQKPVGGRPHSLLRGPVERIENPGNESSVRAERHAVNVAAPSEGDAANADRLIGKPAQPANSPKQPSTDPEAPQPWSGRPRGIIG